MAAERHRLGRRHLLLGGGAVGAAALCGAGYAARDRLERLWWRLPGTEVERTEGEVDHPDAEWVPAASANYRRASRPYDYAIDRVIIHVAQATYQVTLNVFQNPSHGAAAHYVVRSVDGRIAQTVRELDVAYHAGNVEYNERSVGIEHEGWVDRPQYLTDALYQSSARLTAGICDRYNIPKDREHIIPHSAVPGSDHTDPGPLWDWDRYLRLVRAA